MVFSTIVDGDIELEEANCLFTENDREIFDDLSENESMNSSYSEENIRPEEEILLMRAEQSNEQEPLGQSSYRQR